MAAVDLLLELLDLRQPVLSGAAAEYLPEPSAVLRAAGLLRPDGHEAVSASLADHDDVPVSLTWSDQLGGLTYFDPNSGPVAVPDERLMLLRVDVLAVVSALTPSLDLPRGRLAMCLVDGLLWELGDAQIGRRPRVPIWSAPRLWQPAVQQQVADAMRARPYPRQRVILTSTPGDRVTAVVFPGAVVVAVRDVLRSADALAIDVDILDARLGGVPALRDAGPLALSPDGRQLRILGGDPILFRAERQIAAIRLLVNAYQSNRRLPLRDITTDRSLQTLFGSAKWKLLSPHLTSRERLWGFDL